jgi:dynein heavy chain, axonemal
MEEWCGVIDRILAEAEVEGGEDDLGPDAEIDFWKGRMGKLNSVMEQLKLRECRLVIGVVHASKSKLVKRWKHVDAALTDALNEAKV